jgi:O-antigen ligase
VGGALAVVGVAIARYGKDLAAGTLPGFGGDSDRVTSWIAGLQIAFGSPLVGGGWTSVRYWNAGELGKVNVNFSHNIVMQGLADGGVPLGLAMLTLIITAITGIWRFRKSISPIWVVTAVTLLVCGAWDMPQLRTFAAVFGGVALGLVSRRDN